MSTPTLCPSKEGKEEVKMIKMRYVHVAIPQDECSYCVLQTYTDKKELKTTLLFKMDILEKIINPRKICQDCMESPHILHSFS